MSCKVGVFEIETGQTSKYEFYAYINSRKSVMFLASDSLTNLKKEIKARGFKTAWISCRDGSLSYGQNIVDSYPYCPRY